MSVGRQLMSSYNFETLNAEVASGGLPLENYGDKKKWNKKGFGFHMN